ncbi:hypothetical protein CSAL01_11666 [Colletotrichum salicis]|uniref:Uncharacterized protein n=1 Tax=Colletotrichum salicis TaxID=1209931 RepID=A0A135VAJ2_9PEZI|nr:hypothetical protein CSAL01_11666 [Colletotrichum salicis]
MPPRQPLTTKDFPQPTTAAKLMQKSKIGLSHQDQFTAADWVSSFRKETSDTIIRLSILPLKPPDLQFGSFPLDQVRRWDYSGQSEPSEKRPSPLTDFSLVICTPLFRHSELACWATLASRARHPLAASPLPLGWSKENTLADMTLSYGSSAQLFSYPWLEVATAAHDWSRQIFRCIRRSLLSSDTDSAYVSQTHLPTAQDTAASLFQGPTIKDVHLFSRPTTMKEIKADSHWQYANLILFCQKKKKKPSPVLHFCSGMTSDGLSNSAGSCEVPTEEHQHSSRGRRQCSFWMESSGGQPAQSGHRRRESPEGRATAAQRSTPAAPSCAPDTDF